jgi:hypothetical protein
MVWRRSEILASLSDARFVTYMNDDTEGFPAEILVTEGKLLKCIDGIQNRYMLLVH